MESSAKTGEDIKELVIDPVHLPLRKLRDVRKY
jgi:hypothetical protein